jgi:hypothetical protein
MAGRVKATKTAKGLEIQIDHPLARRLDAKLVEGCLTEVLNCADKNACLDDGFALTAACFKTFAKHDTATKCLTTGIGAAK